MLAVDAADLNQPFLRRPIHLTNHGGSTIMVLCHRTMIKPVEWVGSSYKDFRSFPDLVQDVMGFALYLAQVAGYIATLSH